MSKLSETPEESLENIVISRMLKSEALKELIHQEARAEFQKMLIEQLLTREDMAKLFRCSTDTIDRLTEEELLRLGWEKVYVGSLPRFRRIINMNYTADEFKKLRRGKG